MVFGSYDLQKEVAFCAEHDMYMIRPSATSSDADFEAVASNPYYIGEIGPGSELEYEAGADMTRTMAEDRKTYLIFPAAPPRIMKCIVCVRWECWRLCRKFMEQSWNRLRKNWR